MAPTDLTARRRRFAGRRGAAGMGETEFAALADVLLSSEPVEPAAVPATVAPVAAVPVAGEAAVAHGLYLLVPAGIDPAGRREAALAAARRLAPHREPAAVFIFENGLVDAHVLGEMACGRLGPQNYLGAADVDRTVGDLAAQCSQVGLVVLDPPNGRLRRLGAAACRTVFLATPDAESLVETYRTLKAWRMSGMPSQATVLFVDDDGDRATGDLGRRLRRAAQGFLGCDVALERVASAGGGGGELPPALRVLAQTPADMVWPGLLAAVGGGPSPAAVQMEADSSPAVGVAESALAESVQEPTASPAPLPAAAVCPAFGLWQPAGREELVAAVREQVASLFGGSLRLAFEVDVDEPGAPPLAAVRGNGALVAILLPEPGETADTAAAERWLRVHASLLARAYPSSGIAAGSEASAVVLAPLETAPASDGVQRFVPVKLGGHRGVVLLP